MRKPFAELRNFRSKLGWDLSLRVQVYANSWRRKRGEQMRRYTQETRRINWAMRRIRGEALRNFRSATTTKLVEQEKELREAHEALTKPTGVALLFAKKGNFVSPQGIASVMGVDVGELGRMRTLARLHKAILDELAMRALELDLLMGHIQDDRGKTIYVSRPTHNGKQEAKMKRIREWAQAVNGSVEYGAKDGGWLTATAETPEGIELLARAIGG